MAKNVLLGTDIEKLRADFESVKGKPFRYFYCPILHVDENVPLTKGHIVPKSLGGTSKVLQRTDVDNGFGSFFEAEASDAILHGFDGNPLDVITRGDPGEIKKIQRRFKLSVQTDGMREPIQLSCRKEDDIAAFSVRKSDLTGDLKEKLYGLDEPTWFKGLVGATLDARSSIFATSLRTSHLSWFQKLGYRYIFSNEGILVAWILRSLYREFIEPRHGLNKVQSGSLVSDQVKKEVDKFCLQFANLVRPLPKSSIETLPEEIQRGTPDSGWFMALKDGDQIYGRTSIVKLGDQYIGATTPIITDARGWALLDLMANLELEFSFGMFDADAGVYRVDATTHRAIRPNESKEARGYPPISIRQAAEIVIRSGRLDGMD